MKVYPLTIYCGIHTEAARIERSQEADTAHVFAQMTQCGNMECRAHWTISTADGSIASYWKALQSGIIRPSQIADYKDSPIVD